MARFYQGSEEEIESWWPTPTTSLATRHGVPRTPPKRPFSEIYTDLSSDSPHHPKKEGKNQRKTPVPEPRGKKCCLRPPPHKNIFGGHPINISGAAPQLHPWCAPQNHQWPLSKAQRMTRKTLTLRLRLSTRTRRHSLWRKSPLRLATSGWWPFTSILPPLMQGFTVTETG